MANLPETEDFADGTYQIETSDRVIGGPGGIANKQAEQLGNRTAWLKAAIAKIITGTTAIGKATQLATARSMKFKGAASGSGSYDGTADTEVTLTLADSGVAPGSYTKVTLNAKGLVTAGTNPSTLEEFGITNGFAKPIAATDYNLLNSSGLYVLGSGTTANRPPGFSGSTALVHIGGDGYGFMLSCDSASDAVAFRTVIPGGFRAWRVVWHAGNLDPTTKADKSTVNDALLLKANLASPAFSGVVTVPSLPLGTNNQQAANTAFVRAAIADLVSGSPAALDTLKELADALGGDPNFSTTVLNALAQKANKATDLSGYGIPVATPAEVVTGTNKTKPVAPEGVAAAIAAIDFWAMFPIGVPIALLDNIASFSTPPKDKAYRYISLTASDSYNAGVLTGEVVTGSFPLVRASAVVSLAGSPLSGKSVDLINTEQRLLRASMSPGQLLQDALQSVTGSLGIASVNSASGAFSFNRTGGGSIFNGGNAVGDVIFDAGSVARTATETRIKSIGVTYFMRVK